MFFLIANAGNGTLRQREIENGALPREGLHPNAAAITLDNTLANGEADTGSRVRVPMEPLENAEDLLSVLGLDADSVVPYREEPFAGPPLGIHTDPGRLFRTAVLDRVTDQVLEQLNQAGLVRANGR